MRGVPGRCTVHAAILAAGVGRRLRPLADEITETPPDVDGRSVLDAPVAVDHEREGS